MSREQWVRGLFEFPDHEAADRLGRPVTVPGPAYRWRNILLRRAWCGRWCMIHAPSMLAFGASWERLDAAKAAVARMDAECPLSRVDGLDPAEVATVSVVVRKYRQHP